MNKPDSIQNSRAYYSDPNTVALYDAQRFRSARDQMRYRLQWTLLTEMLPAPPARLLEIGCGTSIFTEEVSRRGYKGIAIDPSHAMLSASRERLTGFGQAGHLMQGSGMTMPIAESSVDACFCLNVLSHIPEPIQIVGEMVRTTRPGGSIVFNFTNLSSPVGKLIHYVINPLRRRTKRQKMYTRYHSTRRILTLCNQLPVTIERVTGLFPLDWRIYPRNPTAAWIGRIEAWEYSLSRLDKASLFQQGWVHLRKRAHQKAERT
jgi:ubiquinone/menaquinone biosynthesis C-methylase UbiE